MEPKNIIIAILLVAFFIAVFGKGSEEVVVDVVEEPTEECTERALCIDENTRAYRSTDCSLADTEVCEHGCEAGVCLAEDVETIIVEPVEERTDEDSSSSTVVKGDCAIGFACLDANRRGYRTSDCVYSNVDACTYGCEDGKCKRASTVEVVVPDKEIATSGTATFDILAWRFFDFSDGEILIKDNYDYDAKMRFFPPSSGYDYFPVEGFSGNVWIMDIPIGEITFKECDEGEQEAVSYSNLGPGETLCIRTREGSMAAVGGNWEGLPGRDTLLSWKLFEE